MTPSGPCLRKMKHPMALKPAYLLTHGWLWSDTSSQPPYQLKELAGEDQGRIAFSTALHMRAVSNLGSATLGNTSS